MRKRKLAVGERSAVVGRRRCGRSGGRRLRLGFEALERRLLLAADAGLRDSDAAEPFGDDGPTDRLVRLAHERVIRWRPSDLQSESLAGPIRGAWTIPGWSPTSRLGDLSVLTAEMGAATAASVAGTTRSFPTIRDATDVLWEAPVFLEPQSGLRQFVTDEIIVSLDGEVAPEQFFGIDTFAGYAPLAGTSDQFVATLSGGAGDYTLETVEGLRQATGVEWVSANFVSELRRHEVPNDPLHDAQWHLENTGQFGARMGADANVQEAWDLLGAWDTPDATPGSEEVVLAIFDDGVQTDHPDLADSIWVNPGETLDGQDSDLNGWIDDLHGLNLGEIATNDPNPNTADDNHGTPVAGVAAAVGDNETGVTGAAAGVKIMPIKLGDVVRDIDGNTQWMVSIAGLASAIYYTAGRTADGNGTWRGADVGNHSYSLSNSHPVIDTAFDWAAKNGRGGLGMTNFVAAGNDADGTAASPGYRQYSLSIPAGEWVLEWRYTKNGTISAGEDAAWIGAITLPDGEQVRFDTTDLPAGWSTQGDAAWAVIDDPSHSHGTNRYVARSGAVGHGEQTRLRSPPIVVNESGTLIYNAWVSSEPGTDQIAGDVFSLHLSADGGESFQPAYFEHSGVPVIKSSVGYPAELPSTIAVGASTDWDYRASYSQFGAALDFVAPSSGGFAGIVTTDRTGMDGNNPDPAIDDELGSPDYTNAFSGTSSASPLAAGLAALLLSKNPSMTAEQVRWAMRTTADPIGQAGDDSATRPDYVDGFNEFYGHGRANAAEALKSIGWAVAGEGSDTYDDHGESIAVDGAGNVYVAGVEGGPGESQGEIRLTKYSPAGTRVWGHSIGDGHQDDQRAFALTVDSDGAVYVTGRFRGDAIDFDPGPDQQLRSSTTNASNASTFDAFVLKLDPDGEFRWVKTFGGDSATIDSGHAIALDGQGNLVVAGNYGGAVDFDDSPGNQESLASTGGTDSFVLELAASDGAFRWVKNLGGMGADHAGGLAIDSVGDAYVTGWFNGPEFDPNSYGAIALTPQGSGDAYLIKLDSEGDLAWANQISGTDWAQGIALAVDPSDHVLVIGKFNNVLDLDPPNDHPGDVDRLRANGHDGFVAKYDSTGTFVWGRGISGAFENTPRDAATDALGNLYVTGDFTGAVGVFDPADASTFLLDDDEVGFEIVDGAWTSEAGGFHGDHRSIDAGNDDTKVRWTFTGLEPGRYHLAATWAPTVDATGDANFRIYDDIDQIGSVSVDQRVPPTPLVDAGAIWRPLGDVSNDNHAYLYEVNSGTLVIELSGSPDGRVLADAIRLERTVSTTLTGSGGRDGFVTKLGPTGTPVWSRRVGGIADDVGRGIAVDPRHYYVTGSFVGTSDERAEFDTGRDVPELFSTEGSSDGFVVKGHHLGRASRIVDDSTSLGNGEGFSADASWSPVGNLQALNGGVRQSTAGTGDTATWSFSVTPGVYRVAATWPVAFGQATDAAFTIVEGGDDLGTVVVDQSRGSLPQSTPEPFDQALDYFDFREDGADWKILGTTFEVRGDSLQVRLSDVADNPVVADAVRIERVWDLPGPAAEIYAGSNRVMIDSDVVSLGITPRGDAVTRKLAIHNAGTRDLILQPASAPTGFTLIDNFATDTTVGPGEVRHLNVRLDAVNAGEYSGLLEVPTGLSANDAIGTAGGEGLLRVNLNGVVGNIYYVNDGQTSGDVWTTTVGDNGHPDAGTSPGQPAATVQHILDQYALGPGDVVRIDTGDYALSETVAVTAADGGNELAPVTFEGSPHGVSFGLSEPFPDTSAWLVTGSYVTLTTASHLVDPGSAHRWMQIEGAETGIVASAEGIRLSRLDVHRSSSNGILVVGPSSSDIVIENVLVRGASSPPTSNGIEVSDATGVTIRNSTIYGHANFGIEFGGSSTENFLENSIVWAEGVGATAVSVGAGSSLAADFNNLYASDDALVGSFGGVAHATLADWQAASGFDGRSISIDPRFANVASGDFHLRSTGGRYDASLGLPPDRPSAWVTDAASSSAIDAGNPLSRFDAESPDHGGRANLGAFGNTALASRSADNRSPVLDAGFRPTLEDPTGLTVAEIVADGSIADADFGSFDFQEGSSSSGGSDYDMGAVTIRERQPNDNQDDGDQLIVGFVEPSTDLPERLRGLIEFDLSSLGSGLDGTDFEVADVALSVRTSSANGQRAGSGVGQDFWIDLFRYDFDFDETRATWADPANVEDGQDGDDTTPGGTLGDLLTSSSEFDATATDQTITFPATEAFRDAIADALKSDDQTLRMLVRAPEHVESSVNNLGTYDSHFARLDADNTGEELDRPELLVTLRGPEAIAVTHVDDRDGTWQYSGDGESWNDFNGPTDVAARLLGPADHVRFVPDEGFSGDSSFIFRAWDQTRGESQAVWDVGGTGGNSAFSSATDTAHVQINSPPELAGGSTIDYTENDPPTAIDPTLTIDDADNLTMASATVTISNFVPGEDLLGRTHDDGTMGNIAVAENSGGVLSLVSDGATATLAEWQSALRAVTYVNNGVDPTTTPRSITFVVNDGELDSNVITSTIEVALASGTLSATLNDGALVITDTDLTGKNNHTTVRLSGTDLVISDAGERFDSIPPEGSLSHQGRTLTIPFATVTTSLTVSLAGGDDVMILDLAGGNPIPVGDLNYDGGLGANELLLDGGGVENTTFTYFNSSDGSVRLDQDVDGENVSRVLHYVGLAPISSSLSSDSVEVAYTGGDEAVTITDAGGGRTKVDSTLGSLTTFVNPTSSLEVSAANGSDVFYVDSLAASYASLTIRGDGDSDQANLDGALSLAPGHSLSVDQVGTVRFPNASGDLEVSGSGTVAITASRSISLSSGASITSVDGDIVLAANQQETPTAGHFEGISLDDAAIHVSGEGNINVAGRGGTLQSENHGLVLRGGASVAAAGEVSLTGIGGPSTGHRNYGVFLTGTDTRVSSDGATVSVDGVGGGIGQDTSHNYGTYVHGGSVIEGVGTETAVTVIGTGGNVTGTPYASPVGGRHHGVVVDGAGTRITASGGRSVLVEGTGGGPLTSGNNIGVLIRNAGEISNTGSGTDATVTVDGFGGTAGSSGASTTGVRVIDPESEIGSHEGDVLLVGRAIGFSSVGLSLSGGGYVTSNGGTQSVNLTANAMNLDSPLTVDAANGAVSVRPYHDARQIDLGGVDTSLTLGLTDAELDRIVANSLHIGHATGSTVTVSGTISRPVSTTVTLTGGEAIVLETGSIDTAGGDLRLEPGVGDGVHPRTPGIDVTASDVRFGVGSRLAIEVEGTAVDTGYDQLHVSGFVDVSGTELALAGSYTPREGDVLTIVRSDGVVGTFLGLPDGSVIENLLGGDLDATISYGDVGGDVTLTVESVEPATATVIAATVDDANASDSEYEFSVEFTDNVAIDTSTLDDDDIVVSGPNDFSQASVFVSVDPQSDGAPRTATYRIIPPEGNWDAADNGTYTISLNDDQVFDTAGNAVPGNPSLATFQVDISDVPAPDLQAMPDVTAGTSNTIGWEIVAGADEYFVEYDTDDSFASPDGNSGWIAATEHTFTDLADGDTFYYRVKARSVTAGTTSSWSQTTDSEFATGVLSDVVATTGDGDGEAILDWSGDASKSVFVYGVPTTTTNPLSQAFLDDLINMGHEVTHAQSFPIDPSLYDVIVVTGSTPVYSLDSISSTTLDQYVSDGGGMIVFEGAVRDQIVATSAGSNPVSAQSGWERRTNTIVSDPTSPLVTGLTETSSFSGYSFSPTLKDDADVALQWSDDSTPMAVTYAYGSGHTVFFNDSWAWYAGLESWRGDPTYGFQLMANAVAYVGGGSGYFASGDLVSPAITREPTDTWGSVNFSAATPLGTDLSIDVLPAIGSTPIVGFADVTDGADLAGIDEGTIRLRANLSTTVGSLTPSLMDWGVTWQAPTTHVESLWSASVHSMQDATPPAVGAVTAPDVGDADRGMGNYDFVVEYSDNVAIDVSTFDGNDVSVSGPNGFAETAELVSVDSPGNGTPRSATYRITAPGGEWDTTDNGTYQIATNGGEVSDTVGNLSVSDPAAATFEANVSPVGTLVATLTEGTLTVTDVASAGANNRLTAIRDGADLLIRDLNERFDTAPAGGSLRDDGRTLAIPYDSITGSLVVESASGDDTLTVDFSAGDPVPAGGVSYGGSEASDELILLGGMADVVTHSFVADGNGIVESDGSVIGYSGVDAIDDRLDVADRVFDFGGQGDTIVVSDDPADGRLSMASTLDQTISFDNPTIGLTINTGDGNDDIEIVSLDAAFDARLTVHGESGYDTVDLTGELDLGGGLLDLDVEQTLLRADVTTGGMQRYRGDAELRSSVTITGVVAVFEGDVNGNGNALAIVGGAGLGIASDHQVTELTSLDVSGHALIRAGTISTTATQTYGDGMGIGSSLTLSGTTVRIEGSTHGEFDEENHSLTVEGDLVLGTANEDRVTRLGALTVTGTTLVHASLVESVGDQEYQNDVTARGGNTDFRVLDAARHVWFKGDLIGDGDGHHVQIHGHAILGSGGGDRVSGIDEFTVSRTTLVHTTAVETLGRQRFVGAVTLISDGAITSIGGPVEFFQTVDSVDEVPQSLTVDAGDGDVVFLAPVGGLYRLGALSVDSGGTTRFSSVSATSVSTDHSGATELWGDIDTIGEQRYLDDVVLRSPTSSVVLSGSAMRFDGDIDGEGIGLTLEGEAVLGDESTDRVTDLQELRVVGDATIRSGTITTSGRQHYFSAVTLGANTSLTTTESFLRFVGPVDAAGPTARNLTANAALDVIFVGAVGAVAALGDLTVTAGGILHLTDDTNTEGDVTLTGTHQFTTDGVIDAGEVGSVRIVSERTIGFRPDSGIVTVAGEIDLVANESGSAVGNFVGIDIDAANISTSLGGLSLLGRGGNEGYDSHGVWLRNGTSVRSSGEGIGVGPTTIDGIAVAGSSDGSGVRIENASVVTEDGDIQIIGQVDARDHGALIQAWSSVESVRGNIELVGHGGVLLNSLAVVSSTGTQPTDSMIVINSQRGRAIVEGSITSLASDIRIVGSAVNNESASQQVGVSIRGVISSTGVGSDAATITVLGTGGNESSDHSTSQNGGIRFQGGESQITSVDGDVLIQGQGGNGPESFNHGVELDLAMVSSTGVATVTIEGTAGGGSRVSQGVRLSRSTVTSVDGDISIDGQGGHGSSQYNLGVFQASSSVVSSTGTGANAAAISITGRGGDGDSDNHGIWIEGAGTEVTSEDGDVVLDGQGGTGPGDAHDGVHLYSSALVGSSGTGENAGTVTIIGSGGDGDSRNIGVRINDARVLTMDGDVAVTGLGGEGTGMGNVGVSMVNSALLVSAGEGAEAADITVLGTGGTGTEHNQGVLISGGVVSAVAGEIDLTGEGGAGTGRFNHGFILSSTSVVTSGTGDHAGAIRIDGTGGGAMGGESYTNAGLYVTGDTSVESADGPVALIGTDGVGSGVGMLLANATFEAAGAGDLVITGAVSGGEGRAFLLNGTGELAATGGGNIRVVADSMVIGSGTRIDAAGNSVSLTPKSEGTEIELGGVDDTGILSLTDAELDIIEAATLIIGDGDSGAITVSDAITRPTSTTLELHTGDAILFDPGTINTAGGDLSLSPGDGGVRPVTHGVDVTVGNLAFADGAPVAIHIGGTAVESEYTRLDVAGTVDLGGSVLTLSGTYQPSVDDTFTVLTSDDTVGTFAGLAEGGWIANFLGSGLGATITYTGGDGNDVVLTVRTADPTIESVTASTPLIRDATVSDGTFSVVVTYSRPMDTGLSPTIDYDPDVASTLSFVSEAWSDGDTTYTATYDVADAGVEVQGVDVLVDGARDIAGNPQESTSRTDLFDIDTLNPLVTALTTDATLITDTTAGSGTFAVEVVYDEAMDTSLAPTIGFDPDVGSTLTFASGAWSAGDTTYTATYDVTDAGLEAPGVDISVTGGRDVAGNVHVPTLRREAFDIEMSDPVVPVTVTDVLVASSNWSPTFVDAVDGDGLDAGNGLGASVAPGQVVSHGGIDHIHIVFSKDITGFTSGEIEILGSDSAYPISQVMYDPQTFTATVTLASVIDHEKVRVSVSDSITGSDSSPFDGDSDGAAGGLFDFRFDVNAGDINGDGLVFTTDLAAWQTAFGSVPGDDNYDPAADLNGDGLVFTTDLAVWQTFFGNDLDGLSEPPESGFAVTEPSISVATLDANAVDSYFSDDGQDDEDFGPAIPDLY